jgi:hypothetical protein
MALFNKGLGIPETRTTLGFFANLQRPGHAEGHTSESLLCRPDA